TPTGAREDMSLGDVMPSSFAATEKGDLAFVGENSTRPQEIWLAAAGQQPREYPLFNKTFAASLLARPEIYRYKSFDGLEIEAALLRPGAGSPGKLPLIALIHCGPTGGLQANMQFLGQLVGGRG